MPTHHGETFWQKRTTERSFSSRTPTNRILSCQRWLLSVDGKSIIDVTVAVSWLSSMRTKVLILCFSLDSGTQTWH